MKNAHECFGVLEYTKRMKDTTTRIQLRLDRFIGEVEDGRNGKAHLISVLGGDSDVGAIWAAVIEQNLFSVQAPGIEPVTATWVKTPNASAGPSLSRAANQSATWWQSQPSWPRHVQEPIREAGEPSCVITTRRSCCTASPSGSDYRSCRSGPVGSTRRSTAVERSNRLSAWDALR